MQVIRFHDKNVWQNDTIKVRDNWFGSVVKVQILETTLKYQNYIYKEIKSRLNMKNSSLVISCLLLYLSMKLDLSDKLRIYVQCVQENTQI